MVKKQKKTIFNNAPEKKVKVSKHPLAQPNPKNFRLGNSIRPAIVKSRFVRFPRYVQLQRQKRILMRRLKTPPAIAQFFDTLDKDTTNKVCKILEKYAPETRKEKQERLKKAAKEKIKNNKKTDDASTPVPLKCGLNHVTYLVEQKRAKMVLIAADVDPIETVVFLPTLCKTMDVPYAIVPSKARLGALVGQKTATCLALTRFTEQAAELENLCKVFRERFSGPPAHSRKPEKGYKAFKKEQRQQIVNHEQNIKKGK